MKLYIVTLRTNPATVQNVQADNMISNEAGELRFFQDALPTGPTAIYPPGAWLGVRQSEAIPETPAQP